MMTRRIRPLTILLYSCLALTAACSSDSTSGVSPDKAVGALTAQEQATVCAWAATLVPWPDGAQVTCGALSRTYDEAEFLAGCGSRLAQIPATCSVPVAQLEECVREVMDDLEDDFCDDDEEDDWDDEEECAAILAC